MTVLSSDSLPETEVLYDGASQVIQHSSQHCGQRTKSPRATFSGLYAWNGCLRKDKSLLSLPLSYLREREMDRKRKGLRENGLRDGIGYK